MKSCPICSKDKRKREYRHRFDDMQDLDWHWYIWYSGK